MRLTKRKPVLRGRFSCVNPEPNHAVFLCNPGTPALGHYDEETDISELPRWSSRDPVPGIGWTYENKRLGVLTVRRYLVHAGWLGIVVTDKNLDEYTVFGAELPDLTN